MAKLRNLTFGEPDENELWTVHIRTHRDSRIRPGTPEGLHKASGSGLIGGLIRPKRESSRSTESSEPDSKRSSSEEPKA